MSDTGRQPGPGRNIRTLAFCDRVSAIVLAVDSGPLVRIVTARTDKVLPRKQRRTRSGYLALRTDRRFPGKR
jgi:hypothetical protein